jgi:hypothetical protein
VTSASRAKYHYHWVPEDSPVSVSTCAMPTWSICRSKWTVSLSHFWHGQGFNTAAL